MQMLAVFPDISKYLEWVCGCSAPDLRLHQGLKDRLHQYGSLKGTGEVGAASISSAVVHSKAEKADPKRMSARREG